MDLGRRSTKGKATQNSSIARWNNQPEYDTNTIDTKQIIWAGVISDNHYITVLDY